MYFHHINEPVPEILEHEYAYERAVTEYVCTTYICTYVRTVRIYICTSGIRFLIYVGNH